MSVPTPERLLQRLDWQIIRRLDGILQGDYRSLFQGFGLDLADLREYQFGDDVRAIDWNVTARMDTPYIRNYTEDREVTAWFLLDLSPSVDFGTTTARKRDHLVDFVTVMARLLTRHGNRVGAILYDGRQTSMIPAGSGRVQVLRLIKDLSNQPSLPSVPMSDLSALLKPASNYIRRRSLLFIVSDFISVPGWERMLGLLSLRHELVGVRLYDPSEYDLPDLGTVLIQDSETGEQLYLDTSDRKFRLRFKQAAEQRELRILQAFRRAGVDVLNLSTGEDLVRSLVGFAMLRRQRKQHTQAARPLN